MKLNILDISPEHKTYSIRWYQEKQVENLSLAVSLIANMSSVPCIIVAYWLGELLDYPESLKTTVDRLMKFYAYTEILGKPVNCPW